MFCYYLLHVSLLTAAQRVVVTAVRRLVAAAAAASTTTVAVKIAAPVAAAEVECIVNTIAGRHKDNPLAQGIFCRSLLSGLEPQPTSQWSAIAVAVASERLVPTHQPPRV